MPRFGAYDRTNKTHKCADCPAIIPVSRARCHACSDVHRMKLQRLRAQKAQARKKAERLAAGKKGRRHAARPGGMHRISVSMEDALHERVVALAQENGISQSEQIAKLLFVALSLPIV